MNKLKNNFFLIATSIIFVWIILESYFYSIATQAQKSYETDLLTKAKNYYNLITRIEQSSTNLYFLKEKGAYVKVDTKTLLDIVFGKDTDSIDFISYSQKDFKNKQEYFYEIDKKDGLLKYYRSGVVIELNAKPILDRIKNVWRKFFVISILFTIFTGLFLLLLKFFIDKSIGYRKLSRNLEHKVQEQTKKLDLAFEGAQIGYWHWNVQLKIHEVDKRWLFATLGIRETELKNTQADWETRIHPDDYKKIIPIIESAIEKKKPYNVEFRALHVNGQYIWIQSLGAMTKVDKQGKPFTLSGIYQDITKRKEIELLHKKSEIYLKTLYEKNPNIIMITTEAEILQANEAFFNFFKEYTSIEEFKKEHRCVCDFFMPSKYNDTIVSGEEDWIHDILTSDDPIVRIEYLDKEHYFSVYAKKIYDENQMQMMVTFNDITDMYRLRHRFEELSIHDALTHIYNRRYFNIMFPQELNRSKRTHESFCFAIVDVDNFKLYNDNYGHDEGDKVLQHITEEISKFTQRSNEFFFRLGGEEFGIISSADSFEEVNKHFNNIAKAIQKLQIEHLYNEWFDVVTISIGLCYLSDAANGDTKDIYKSADNALYRAKETGRNKVVLFQEC